MAYDFKADLRSQVNKNPPARKPDGPKKPTSNAPAPPVKERGFQPKSPSPGRSR